MSLFTAFNNVLLDFMDDCILVFPEEKDFNVFKKGIELLKKFNPKKIPLLFKEYVKFYKTEIKNRNEDFFLKNNYKDIDIIKDDNEIFNIINKIKEYWKTLSEENKNKIWNYLDIMIKLTDNI